MDTDLAACLASTLRVSEPSQDADMETASAWSDASDCDIDVSMDDATEGPYEIRFEGRHPRRDGVPLRLLIDNPFRTPFMRADAADEPIALFEGFARDYIVLSFEVKALHIPALRSPPLIRALAFGQFFGREADAEMVRVKDDASEPVTARALAENIAQCYLEFMRQRSGDLDSKNPAIDGVSFQQLYLVALHSVDGVHWRVEVQ